MTIEEIVASVLSGVGPVTNETGYETDQRWTSRAHVQILGKVSAAYGVTFRHDELEMCRIPTVADLKRAVFMKGGQL